MNELNLELLQNIACDPQNPKSCWDAVVRLRPLAPWIMKSEYLESACRCPLSQNCPKERKTLEEFCQRTPTLAQGKGCCHILFAVTKQGSQQVPCLRSAFALPLIWRENADHSAALPEKLRALAEQVVDQAKPVGKWGLSWNFGTEVSWKLDLDYDSAWATLAASLLLATEGGRPQPNVWATAAWDRQMGVRKVEGIEEKLEIVYDLGGRKLFVPAENFPATRSSSDSLARKRGLPLVEISPLNQTETRPSKVLSEYMKVLDIPPDKSQPLEERCRYHTLWNSRAADKYYLENLLEDLARKCRQEGIEGIGETDVENLITFVSLNTGALLVLSVFRPRRVLLFYTEESRQDLSRFEERCEKQGISVEKVFLDGRESEAKKDEIICRAIQDFVERHGVQKTAIDVTPGPKNFSVIASWAVDPKTLPCIFLAQSWKPDRTPITGSERIRRLVKIV